MTDNANRPLLNIVGDTEMLLGKPVHFSPTLDALGLSLGNNGALIFGDLSHIKVRASRPTIQRVTQQAIVDISRGECLYVARQRADALYFDPTGGNYPPCVLYTIN
jgi:HK97 family phage major capsid protein